MDAFLKKYDFCKYGHLSVLELLDNIRTKLLKQLEFGSLLLLNSKNRKLKCWKFENLKLSNVKFVLIVTIILFFLGGIAGYLVVIEFCEDGHRQMMSIGQMKSQTTWI